MTPAEGLAAAAVAILLLAACFDLWRMEIPDTLSILLLMVTIAARIAAPDTPVWPGLAALAAMLLLGLFLFARGWMGGGDIKLLVALSPLAGLSGLVTLLAAIAIAGGLLAAVMQGLRAGLGRAVDDPMRLPLVLRPEAPLPYAVAIAAGAGFWAWRTGVLPV